MKILFVLENHYPNIGGVETLFKNLTESLVIEGHYVTILTNQFSPDLKRQEVLEGVNIIRVPFKNRYLFTLLGIFPAIKYGKKHDVIHTTSYNAGVPAFFAGLFTRKKVIITFHEVWGKLWFGLPYMSKISLGLHYLFEKALLQLPFYKYVAVSKYTAKSLVSAGVKESKVELIHNGIRYVDNKPMTPVETIHENKASTDDEKCFNYMYFGRLGISKGIDIILDAVEQLKANHSAFKLLLIIPTQPKDFHKKIRDTILTKKIGDWIDIRSDLEKSELEKTIVQSDAVIIPSYSEGFCFTAVESMALGAPIITSGKGALKEVVSGKFIEMESHDAKGLSAAMELALEGKWTHTSLVRFPLSDSIKKYMAMYDAINV